MGILRKISIRNFKCFREKIDLNLMQGNYLIGPNNAGKTAVLQAIKCFFDNDYYSQYFLNRTEFTRRQTGFNRTDISITFDINLVTGRVRHDRMQDKYGDSIDINKSFTWREQSESVYVTYSLNGGGQLEYDQLDDDVQHLLASIAISYIHPQEGAELLQRAQEKFKQRLFHNWGRHASVAERLAQAQKQWDELRSTANAYLSKTLTERIREMWPSSEVKINLPEKLEKIVAISDITFRSSNNLPEVSLTSHGTGAQSIILYQTHFILDSDRSLHQGMYFPIWLLEEPESFLHADIAFQLGRLLAGGEWQANIQMVISTHSPIILAGSKIESEEKKWIVVDKHEIMLDKKLSGINIDDVRFVGKLMGDSNFEAYFAAADGKQIFLEDSRNETVAAFHRSGLKITKGLDGISDVKRYIKAYSDVTESLSEPVYFIVDGDEGINDLKSYLQGKSPVAINDGWRKFQLENNLYVIALPDGSTVEDCFEEWVDIVDEAIDDLLDKDMNLKTSIPTRLSRVVSKLRSAPPQSREDAYLAIKNIKDIKDKFWAKISEDSIQIPKNIKSIIESLIT